MTHLTYASAAILQAVACGYRYGFDIMEATGLPSGTVYPALRRLERNGWLRSRWEPNSLARQAGRPRRKYYEISAPGQEVLSRALQRFSLLTQILPAEG